MPGNQAGSDDGNKNKTNNEGDTYNAVHSIYPIRSIRFTWFICSIRSIRSTWFICSIRSIRSIR